MSDLKRRHEARDGAPLSTLAIDETTLAVAWLASQAAVVVASALLTGTSYHLIWYGVEGPWLTHLGVGLLAALLFITPLLYRGDDRITRAVRREVDRAQIFMGWNYTFLVLGLAGFVTKTTADFSRGAVLAFYVVGLCGLLLVETLLVRRVARLVARGHVRRRRVLLVGSEAEIERFASYRGFATSGLQVAGTAVLPPAVVGANSDGVIEVMREAAAKARLLEVDDVFLLSPWSEAARIDTCVAQFSLLPVAVHLTGSDILVRFPHARPESVGGVSTLSLTDRPLNPLQRASKRALDIAVALVALIGLSPLLIAAAIAIKLDSKGPVFFRQRRAGFNQREFRIWKFRSMTVADDGETIVQARKADPRVTRVGAWLRRTSIDELPQLLNVIAGDMSIVGPRPHALAHDREFEKRIAAYPRRLNVKPGITGWAQINGFRGETDTDEKLTGRISHDLYYVDNWSLGLVLYIILMTFLSAKTFRNAH